MVRNGVLNTFPLTPSLYADDVRAIMDDTIGRYGEEEWRTIVMTNEIHGHLGIYSTIGAKMGLYALSLLSGDGEPTVISFAGTTPPVSCFNDGLQISTGATLGHGLITISDEREKRIEALFTLNTKTIRLALHPDRQEQIRQDIRCGVQLYGNTPHYWQHVRMLAIKYWHEWDRNNIFILYNS